MLSKQFVCGRRSKVVLSILFLLSSTYSFSMEFLSRYFAPKPQTCDVSTQVSSDPSDEQETLRRVVAEEWHGQEEFGEGTIVRVVRGPEKYRNKVMIIKGTTKETWGFEDVDGAPEAFRYNPTLRYLETDHPGYGIVYYAQYAHNLLKDCVHESWLERAEDFDEDDIVVGAEGGPTEDGRYVNVYRTRGEVNREFQRAHETAMRRRAEALQKGGDDDAFKKEYINQYFPAVQMQHDSLVRCAPADLKKWFEEVAQEKRTQPLLLYGAYGVGKTMTSQALAKAASCSLCYMSMPADMRDDASSSFYRECFSRISRNTCVVLDNVLTLEGEDLENIHWLVDTCNTRQNLHLLIIAYHAKRRMPAALYDQFRAIKFAVPTTQERLKLLRHFLESSTLARDVDERFLEDANRELSNFTARDLESLRHASIMQSYADEDTDKDKRPIVLSRTHLEEGLKTLRRDEREMRIVFDECE